MIIEHKSADAAEVKGGGAITTDDPMVFNIIGSVTGVRDEVNDIIEPGAYAETLTKRIPKVIKDHQWSDRLGRVLHIEEYLPGDARLPQVTAQGKVWPREAGALVAKVKLFQSAAGREAAERWREYGSEQQYSIGYVVPPGKASKGKDGVRHIKSLDLFEISDVLWGAMPLAGPMPAALATKMLAEIEAEEKTGGLRLYAEDDTPLDDDGFTADELDAAVVDLDATEVKTALVEYEEKYDTSPVGERGGRQNWVDKAGGLPKMVRAVAHALIRKGRDESSAIAIAVATIKKWAAGGDNVNPKTRAKAQAALAEWERKKKAGRKEIDLDLFGWDPALDAEARAAAAFREEKSLRLGGTFEERMDLLRGALHRTFVRAETVALEIDGTYGDKVIFTLRDHAETPGTSNTLSVPYLVEGAAISLGEPTPVRLAVQEPHSDEALAAEIATVLDGALAGVKTLSLGMETKAGRVLSGGNAARIRAAVESLLSVLRAAGVEITAPAAPAKPATEAKKLFSFTAEGLPDPAELVAALRLAAGNPNAEG